MIDLRWLTDAGFIFVIVSFFIVIELFKQICIVREKRDAALRREKRRHNASRSAQASLSTSHHDSSVSETP